MLFNLLRGSSASRVSRAAHGAWSFRHGGVAPGQARPVVVSGRARAVRHQNGFSKASAHAVGTPSESIATDKGRLPARPRPPLERGVERRLGLGVVVIFVGQHRRVQQLHDAIDHDLEHHGPSCEAVDEALGLAGR